MSVKKDLFLCFKEGRGLWVRASKKQHIVGIRKCLLQFQYVEWNLRKELKDVRNCSK